MSTRRFYELLAGEGQLTFQTFADQKTGTPSDKRLARILPGTLADLTPTLRRLNQEGAGIFVCVNRMDGEWRGLSHLTAVLSYYTEVDGLDRAGKRDAFGRFLASELPPSVIVDSRNGLHAYWLAHPGEDPAYYREVEEGLIHAFGGDPGAKDAARVLRAPGFYHRKADPYPVRVVHLPDDPPRYVAGELALAYPPPPQPVRPTHAFTSQPAADLPATARLLALMDYCSALWTPGNRHEMGLALAGKLWWWGVPEAEALRLVREVCRRAGDPDPVDREAAVRTTYARAARGEGVSTYSLKSLTF